MGEDTLRVLLVEDNQDDAELIRLRLRPYLGNQLWLDKAESFANAKAMLCATQYDAVLLDLALPDSYGIEAIHAIHAVRPGITIVILTGLSDDGIAQAAQLAGAQGYLLKDEANAALILRTIRFAVERSQLSHMLQSAEKALSRLVVNSADAMLVVDSDGNYQFINPAAEILLNQSKSTLLNQRCDLTYTIGQKIECEMHVPPSKTLSVEIQALTGEWHGESVTLVMIHDVTERRARERERAMLASTVEHAGTAVAATDANGLIQYVNPAYEQILGVSRATVLGTPESLLDMVPEYAGSSMGIRDRVAKNEVWKGRITNKRLDGKTVYLDATVTAVRDINNAIIGYVVIKSDVTRQVEIEENIQKSYRLEALGQLAAGVAHDFNNILGAIIGYTELAAQDMPAQQQSGSDLERVLQAAYRARDLVAQILSFGRHEPTQFAQVQVGRIVEEVLKLVRSSLAADIEIQQEIDLSSSSVTGNASQIHQVVLNVCINAAQAMERKGGILKARVDSVDVDEHFAKAARELKPGKYVRVAVSDTGCGIPPDTIDRIFEPFCTTKPKDKGTGLGLFAVKDLVQAHGGTVTVYSEVDKGTTFKIYLPQSVEVETDVGEPTSDLPRGKGEHVLVVDDEAALVQLSKALLEYLGYKVTGFYHSPDALQASLWA